MVTLATQTAHKGRQEGRKAGRLKGRFAQEWIRLFGTVLGMACMGVFLCACDTPDVMTGAACSCWRPEPLTTSCLLPENLSFDGFVIFGYGNIQEVTVQGGKDVDWSFPQENDPDFSYCDPNCGEGEGEMGEICYWDGLPKQCRLSWENSNTPYVWAVSGYVRNCAVDTNSPLWNTCYMETVEEYERKDPPDPPEEQPKVNIRVVRSGAFQPEFTIDQDGLISAPNEAVLEVSKNVWAPPTYHLRAALPQGVSSPGELTEVAEKAGRLARKQDSEDPEISNDLKTRFNDQMDRHVNINFEITSAVEEWLPKKYCNCCNCGLGCQCSCAACEGVFCHTAEEYVWIYVNPLKLLGYNIWVLDDIIYSDECLQAWGLGEVPGSFMWLSTQASPLEQVFLHEFGHNLGLSDDMYMPYNVMHIGYYRGSDINSDDFDYFLDNIPEEYMQY